MLADSYTCLPLQGTAAYLLKAEESAEYQNIIAVIAKRYIMIIYDGNVIISFEFLFLHYSIDCVTIIICLLSAL